VAGRAAEDTEAVAEDVSDCGAERRDVAESAGDSTTLAGALLIDGKATEDAATLLTDDGTANEGAATLLGTKLALLDGANEEAMLEAKGIGLPAGAA
jgi:hypothetical protein